MQINQKPQVGVHAILVRLLQHLRHSRISPVFRAASTTTRERETGFRFAISLLLALFLCTVAPTFAAPATEPTRAKPAKPLTFKQALSAEQELLRNPMVKRILERGGSIGDDKLLEVIDKAQQAGKAGDLPEAVLARLEAWRKERALEEAYRKAPWVHGPARVAIKGPVYLQVPKGFKFLDPEAVKKLPHELQVPSFRALLANDDDTFAAVISATETGHLATEQLKLDADSILRRIHDKFTDPLRNPKGFMDVEYGIVAKPEWINLPHYDAARHVVSWAHTEPRKTTPRMYAVRFGKTWAAEIQVIAPGFSASETPIELAQKFAAAVEFSPGDEYDDADARTQKAGISMIDLIGGPPFRYPNLDMQRPSTWETIKPYLFRFSPILLILIAALMRARRPQNNE